ncbi:hypothetical protein BESB_076120 [Besnoitia besnoiti]|uniref:Uncharacterized protein n=1 Tax=Besnoitia besnoiti TaxID=94643 RepID=A0A2A9M609_BESBE|nr:hypothetical protein BESB_076120 [Besnoitia besnoiti]PFH33395.1 hypothetical protein BESB_076120 [Besnoitia besnoiti]
MLVNAAELPPLKKAAGEARKKPERWRPIDRKPWKAKRGEGEECVADMGREEDGSEKRREARRREKREARGRRRDQTMEGRRTRSSGSLDALRRLLFGCVSAAPSSGDSRGWQRKVLFVTGAGLSVASGVPLYRAASVGEEVSSIRRKRRRPSAAEAPSEASRRAPAAAPRSGRSRARERGFREAEGAGKTPREKGADAQSSRDLPAVVWREEGEGARVRRAADGKAEERTAGAHARGMAATEWGTISAFRREKEKWFSAFWYRAHDPRLFRRAFPSPGHFVLAFLLLSRPSSVLLLTQNVDGLQHVALCILREKLASQVSRATLHGERTLCGGDRHSVACEEGEEKEEEGSGAPSKRVSERGEGGGVVSHGRPEGAAKLACGDGIAMKEVKGVAAAASQTDPLSTLPTAFNLSSSPPPFPPRPVPRDVWVSLAPRGGWWSPTALAQGRHENGDRAAEGDAWREDAQNVFELHGSMYGYRCSGVPPTRAPRARTPLSTRHAGRSPEGGRRRETHAGDGSEAEAALHVETGLSPSSATPTAEAPLADSREEENQARQDEVDCIHRFHVALEEAQVVWRLHTPRGGGVTRAKADVGGNESPRDEDGRGALAGEEEGNLRAPGDRRAAGAAEGSRRGEVGPAQAARATPVPFFSSLAVLPAVSADSGGAAPLSLGSPPAREPRPSTLLPLCPTCGSLCVPLCLWFDETLFVAPHRAFETPAAFSRAFFFLAGLHRRHAAQKVVGSDATETRPRSSLPEVSAASPNSAHRSGCCDNAGIERAEGAEDAGQAPPKGSGDAVGGGLADVKGALCGLLGATGGRTAQDRGGASPRASSAPPQLAGDASLLDLDARAPALVFIGTSFSTASTDWPALLHAEALDARRLFGAQLLRLHERLEEAAAADGGEAEAGVADRGREGASERQGGAAAGSLPPPAVCGGGRQRVANKRVRHRGGDGDAGEGEGDEGEVFCINSGSCLEAAYETTEKQREFLRTRYAELFRAVLESQGGGAANRKGRKAKRPREDDEHIIAEARTKSEDAEEGRPMQEAVKKDGTKTEARSRAAVESRGTTSCEAEVDALGQEDGGRRDENEEPRIAYYHRSVKNEPENGLFLTSVASARGVMPFSSSADASSTSPFSSFSASQALEATGEDGGANGAEMQRNACARERDLSRETAAQRGRLASSASSALLPPLSSSSLSSSCPSADHSRQPQPSFAALSSASISRPSSLGAGESSLPSPGASAASLPLAFAAAGGLEGAVFEVVSLARMRRVVGDASDVLLSVCPPELRQWLVEVHAGTKEEFLRVVGEGRRVAAAKAEIGERKAPIAAADTSPEKRARAGEVNRRDATGRQAETWICE